MNVASAVCFVWDTKPDFPSTIQTHIDGVREGRCLNTTAFAAKMRCLTVIMMFNLYLVKKLTTINNARAIFLMELKENTYIDIVLISSLLLLMRQEPLQGQS